MDNDKEPDHIEVAFKFIASKIRRAKDSHIRELSQNINKMKVSTTSLLTYLTFDLIKDVIEDEFSKRGLKDKYKYPKNEDNNQ